MNVWMKRSLRVVVALPALLFVVMGLRWLVNPAGIAPELGLDLQTGLGLSSQVGDPSAFFLVAGLSVLIGLVTQRRTWFYPAVLLLLFAAVGRMVAWVLHGADFALQMIVVEIVLAGLFLMACRTMDDR